MPKNSGNIQYTTLTNNYLTYQCVTSGSIGSIGYYPKGISGIGSLIFTTASCTNQSITASWTGGNAFNFADYTYTSCGGQKNGITVRLSKTKIGAENISANLGCVDNTFPGIFIYGGSSPLSGHVINTSGSCLNSYISTGSCGCP